MVTCLFDMQLIYVLIQQFNWCGINTALENWNLKLLYVLVSETH